MSILIWYFILFAPQLVIGAAIGWWVAHRRGGEVAPAEQTAVAQPADEESSEEAVAREEELRLALSQLKSLTDSVQEDVREHAEKVDVSSKELASLESDDASGALAAIGPIVKANE